MNEVYRGDITATPLNEPLRRYADAGQPLTTFKLSSVTKFNQIDYSKNKCAYNLRHRLISFTRCLTGHSALCKIDETVAPRFKGDLTGKLT